MEVDDLIWVDIKTTLINLKFVKDTVSYDSVKPSLSLITLLDEFIGKYDIFPVKEFLNENEHSAYLTILDTLKMELKYHYSQLS